MLGKGLHDEAIDTYSRALKLDPDLAATRNNLGTLFVEQGRLDDAIACFRRAVELKPDYSEAASNFVSTLTLHPDYGSGAILAEHRDWARRFAEPLATQIRSHDNSREPDRRLKIGFLSRDLRAHPVGYSLLPLFSNRDRRHTEFVCYADVKLSDRVTASLKALSDGWRNTVGMSDHDVAERIRGDRIDLLVDLAVHTTGNRMLVFAPEASTAPGDHARYAHHHRPDHDRLSVHRSVFRPARRERRPLLRGIRPSSPLLWCYEPPEDSPPAAPVAGRSPARSRLAASISSPRSAGRS